MDAIEISQGSLFMRSIALCTILALSTSPLLAQSADTDVGEISLYAGAPFGALNGGALIGGSFAGAFSKFGLGLIDANYASIGHRSLRSHVGSIISNSHLYDFNFSLHLRVPLRPNFAPYALVGTAYLYNPFEIRQVESGNTSNADEKDSEFGFEVGGGFRYYVWKNVGIRTEYRYTFSSQNFNRILRGFLYQFGG